MRYFAIINYGDRKHSTQRTLKAMQRVFERRGKECVFNLSKSIQHSAELIERASAEKFDAILIGGGDGTVNSILNLTMGKNFVLGVLPLGTVNALAQTIGMPNNPVKACEAIIDARPRLLTLGRVNDRYFLCFASIGFDAATVHRVSPKIKRALRNVAFGLAGVWQLTQLKDLCQFKATYFPDGKTETAYSLIISNLPIYAGFRMFRALPYRSRMELYLFKNNRLRNYFKYFTGLAITRGQLEKLLPDVTRTFVERVEVKSSHRMFLQLDGEPYTIDDDKHYEFVVIRKAVKLLVPPRVKKTSRLKSARKSSH
ncbi:hypothetical protein J7M23_01650 [Candidatus Sumerlaeota bacterium]|nr:hypothetical protein [Candidatus Sumerlaeota bacterium]